MKYKKMILSGLGLAALISIGGCGDLKKEETTGTQGISKHTIEDIAIEQQKLTEQERKIREEQIRNERPIAKIKIDSQKSKIENKTEAKPTTNVLKTKVPKEIKSNYLCAVSANSRVEIATDDLAKVELNKLDEVLNSFQTQELTGKLATLTPINKNPIHRRNELTGESLTVYFRNKSWTLHKNDLIDISNYGKSLKPKKVSSLIVEGHADINGSETLNNFLSEERAQGIKTVLERNLKKKIPIKIVAYGKSKPAAEGNDFESLQKSRRGRIILNKSIIAQGLDLLVSDFYLIDQSSSMSENSGTGKTKWQEVQSYQFPKKARVYVFSGKNRGCTGHLETSKPYGSTPLFKSLYQLVDSIEPGKSITVLSDGKNNLGHTTPREVLDLALARNIQISVVGLKLSGEYKTTLENMARITGGSFYMSAEN